MLLTKKRQAYAKKTKKTGIMRGGKLAFNAGVQARYQSALLKLVRQMSDEVKKEIQTLYKKDHAKAYFGTDESITSQARILTNKLKRKFERLFNEKALYISESMVNQSDKTSKSALYSSLKELSGGLSLKTDFLTNDLQQITKAAVIESTGLIKSIQQDYMQKVQGAVMRSITHGDGLEGLIGDLQQIDGVTERRAKFIALDQTKKIYNTINVNRSIAVGVEEGEWIHSGGSQHPRESHIDLDNEPFDLEKGAYDEDYGDYVLPGQLPGCNCTFRPIIRFNEGEPSL